MTGVWYSNSKRFTVKQENLFIWKTKEAFISTQERWKSTTELEELTTGLCIMILMFKKYKYLFKNQLYTTQFLLDLYHPTKMIKTTLCFTALHCQFSTTLQNCITATLKLFSRPGQ